MAKPQNITRHLASVDDAATRADVSARTIRRWIATGRLPGYRVGPRLVKIDVTELDAVICRIPTAGGDAA